ncbi:MAG: UbiA family prenyltransferase [Saprospiraceae bacterium]|nr:UbiA family prenyltransferase [Saprospiraceae bacterium]
MWRDTIKLLRIPFSFFLMPVFLLALSQAESLNTVKAWWAFFIIHLLIYPASNGYNSYVDRDETPIGGLEKPPMPTEQLFYATLFMDMLAIILAFVFVKPLFALCLCVCVTMSRAYSARQIRLKKYAYGGFLVVAIFQGAFTYFMTSVAVNNDDFQWNTTYMCVLLAASFQIAGVYPLTQIYQHQEDLRDGVTTISYKLGYRGTFFFSALMFGLCMLSYFLYFNATGQLSSFFILQACFLPPTLFFIWWFLQVFKNTQNANFRNTMLMNLIASVCMSLCFLILFLKPYIKF